MPVKIVCVNPECDASYSIADENLGGLGRCKKCGTKFPLVPGTRVEAAPSSPQTDLDSISKQAEAVLPDSFGRYKVVRILGRGGMGSVYLALDTQLKRQVALKVPHITAFGDRPDVRERFFREAQAAARFHHPNFCPIHDIGEVSGVPYLTMAFIEGKTLAASIEWGVGWRPRRAVEVTRELALALAKAHREGIIHRDLKPANVMVAVAGGLVLMDFGLARWYDDFDSTFTPSGAVLGTPAYMPPEQAEGNLKAIGPRSDIYSLGVILYELLTGRRPFEGSLTKVLGMIAFVAPPPPSTHRPDLDPRLEAICLKALAKKPEDRHASMDEFAGALTAYLTEEVVLAPVVRPEQAQKQPSPLIETIVAKQPTTLRASAPDGKLPIVLTLDGSEVRSPRSRSPISIGAAAALVFAAVIFGIIIYVATDQGQIKIEINDPNAVVHVDGKEVRIESVGDPLMLTTGEHNITIERGDIVVKTRKFVVKRGDNEPLKITLEPFPPPTVAPMPPTVARVEPPSSTVAPMPPTVAKVDSPPTDIPKPSSSKVNDSLITNSIGMKLKLIPAGEFAMGSDASDRMADDNEMVNGKKHKVRITEPFYMGTTEVTVGQFRRFVETSNYKTEAERNGGGRGWNEAALFELDPKYTWRSPGFPQTDDHPAVLVSWNDAAAFTEWLSREETLTYRMPIVYRLPTEAQWEYSCRAGLASQYSSGDDPELLATVGNVKDGTFKEQNPKIAFKAITANDGFVFTAPVGQYRANGFGLFDMHGNVSEWCADWYESDYYSKSPPADPQNCSTSLSRVIRGGSWLLGDPLACRSAKRGGAAPESIDQGFRVARVQSGQ